MPSHDAEGSPSSEGARFALRVDVRYEGRTRYATLLGQTQADAAAAGGAGVARPLIDGEIVRPGAWMPEQVINPEAFLFRLATRGLRVEFPDGVSPLGPRRMDKAVA